jgi:hypothetical protein
VTVYRRLIEIFTRDRRPTGPPAMPGPWFGSYHADWDRDHPGMWMKGDAQSGGFYAGDVWAGSTLDWDRVWFAAHGMSMPRKYAYRLDPIGPGCVRIDSLGPGESVTFQVDGNFGDEEDE